MQRYLERTDSPFVFPGDGIKGYLNEPRKQMNKVIEESGVEFTLHDLRRTFITVAESLDISGYALKRLANHKMANDVTAGYIISDVQRLREPMQRITNFLLESMHRVHIPLPLLLPIPLDCYRYRYPYRYRYRYRYGLLQIQIGLLIPDTVRVRYGNKHDSQL